MTSKINLDGSINRRTTLGLLSGGVAALAGCSGGSSDGTRTDEGESDYPESGWIDPANYSEYITSSEMVARTTSLRLKLELKNSTEIEEFKIIDARGNEYLASRSFSDSAELPVARADNRVSPPESYDPITPGENTLVITFEDDRNPQRIPLRLNTSMEFQRVELSEDSRLSIVIKNTGSHATVAWRTDYSNMPPSTREDAPAGDGHILHDLIAIPPGETHAVDHGVIWQAPTCDEYDARNLGFTVRSLWANNISISQRATYEEYDTFNCGSPGGDATLTSDSEPDSQ